MEHPKDVGDHSTLALMMALRNAGYRLYVPFGENSRCDLVIDDACALHRVQCKTGRLRDGAILFPTASRYAHHRNARVVRRDYQGEVDYFGDHCPDNGRAYLIPLEVVSTRTSARLRIDPARNRQRRTIRTADVYEIGRLAMSHDAAVTTGLGATPGG
jgi:hypothetical protein